MKKQEHVLIFVCFVLLVLVRAAHVRGWVDVGAPVGQLLDTMSNRGLNKEAREAMTAGYYEGLLNEGSRVSSMNRLLTDNRRLTFENRAGADRKQVNSFLFYELAPNMDQPDYEDERQRYRLKTNSLGLADKEYALQKTPGTRRIALLGDSISRGQGAPFGGNYESLLEDRLNAAHIGGPVRQFEILNFSVGSYNITQLMDVALEKVPPFEADVYVVAMTHLSVYRRWGQHIALLMHGGIDLKYDYLRQLAHDAGLDASEPIGVFDAKLARFRLRTLRWALAQIKQHAERKGARVLVLMVPTADRASDSSEAFLGVPEILRDLDLVYVDLLDSFDQFPDLAPYVVAERDRHPNAAGHQVLSDKLYERILSTPRARDIVLGDSAARKQAVAGN